ncbi:MAG: PhnD/SsuA/transferrin family substrate-binding protein [Roseicyclus sp.]|jgi:ABC-type phosphate/phosphonate transport system substrate-binding protein|nr:PhnD/SsuA/transferrin family substrate-binding protein [Roseicyclus sp.]MBO6626600.1 PhnD/SsuA/transferrin family substrate-binding protein [Roseicyclus sp.]MBO6921784.1 PhnD/SsuA/transferrin family substrate-binding protein [Roseicyclus sp.]
MIAALPMYDRAEIRDATDRFWALIRDELRRLGLDAPAALTRDTDPWEIWQSPDLILAQTCGLPYRARLAPHVTLVTTPDYALPGCPPGHYNSVIVARSTKPGPRPAVNDALSQSGWAALSDWAAATGHRLDAPLMTGAHEASARAVAEARADLAAIDAQTWRLLTRHAPFTADLVEVARTAPTPGLPLITAGSQSPAPIRAALDSALAALDPADRAALGLHGFSDISESTYLAQPMPPKP